MNKRVERSIPAAKARPANISFLVVVLIMALTRFGVALDINNGLAMYKTGNGPPVLLMPYPHASGGSSMSESVLANMLVALGRTVITFDPPGLYRSARQPRISMDEMLMCAEETLDRYGFTRRIDVMGHSMGGFCALAFAIERSERVKRLVLIGSTSGWPAVKKWGVHKHWKWWRDREYWQSRFWGTRIMLGLDNLAVHKRLDYIVDYASYVDKSLVAPLGVLPGDRKLPAPARTHWMSYLRKHRVDYRNSLPSITGPTLICAGRYDPQTPPAMNEELHRGIPDSCLVFFDSSGHSPFAEEPEKFSTILEDFLDG
ncbi:MAG: hypothetical protein CMN78_01525 [Spirochaetales bacterium]|nr:hypothetical protein [Spirochaetales bacterium]